MSKRHFIVELRQPALVVRLRNEVSRLHSEVESLTRRLSTLEQRFGYEVMLNSELIDLLNMNHISYREHLDFKKHPF